MKCFSEAMPACKADIFLIADILPFAEQIRNNNYCKSPAQLQTLKKDSTYLCLPYAKHSSLETETWVIDYFQNNKILGLLPSPGKL
jgi:hypothetical protein